MQLIKVASVSLNQIPLDWEGNQRRVIEGLTNAQKHSAQIVCFPELCLTGYGCEDAFFAAYVHKSALDLLFAIEPHTKGLVAAIGLPFAHNGAVYDSAALLVDGALRGITAKQFLAREGIHYEPRWFKAWEQDQVVKLNVRNRNIPFGDLVYDLNGFRIGFEICEDAWAPDRPGIRHSGANVDLILNPSASHFAFEKYELRKRFVLEGSRAFGCGYIYSNLVGNEAGRAIYDGSSLIAASGKLLECSERFRFEEVQVTTGSLDLDSIRLDRTRSAAERNKRSGATEHVESIAYQLQVSQPEARKVSKANWEQSQNLKEEEFARAVMLGLFDYLRKSKSQGFVISLSGGVDSAACASLVALMLHKAFHELGPSGIKASFSYCGDFSFKKPEDLVRHFLTCVYQSTAQSSALTKSAAEGVSKGINATHINLDVEPIVKNYIAIVSEALDRKLTWEKDDLPLQNIQARARGPSVWLIANIKKALLLATSNRSEAAVGYTTMDGDTCGGLSPIAGIDKAYLRAWLKWLQVQGPSGLFPIPALAAVNEQEPTAELRPSGSKQTDEKDLMPYEVLDVIERYAIRDKQSPVEVFAQIKIQFPKYEDTMLKTWVERFFQLWSKNQWKRERYAPCFHLDDENLDPKTWCRFPILSGGYERELRDLK